MNRDALHPDSLEHAVFEKVRRCGPDRANGQTIWQNGKAYDLTVNTISTVKTVHVVMRQVNDEIPTAGVQRAMAIVAVHNNGYVGGPNGLTYTLTALVDGVRCAVRGRPSLTDSFFVLPFLDVPPCFEAPWPEDEAPDHTPDA